MSPTDSNFGSYSVQSTADAGKRLVRLLIKLSLLDPSTDHNSFSVANALPIRHFSEAGAFNEQAALQAVGMALGIDTVWIDRGLAEALTPLLNRPPFDQISTGEWALLIAAPLAHRLDTSTIAFANPLDHDAIQRLEFLLEKRVEVVIGNEQGIREIHTTTQSGSLQRGIDLIVNRSIPSTSAPTQVDFEFQSEKTSPKIEEDDPNGAPVVRIVNRIISEGVAQGASDIHLSPQEDCLQCRIRVDGILRPLLEVPLSLKNPVISRIKMLTAMDLAEKRLPQDGRFQVKTIQGVRDLRVSTVPSNFGESIVIRVLANTLSQVDLRALKLPEDILTKFTRLLKGSSKVVLVTGPTGSGKTSTLYAALKELHDGERNIVTLEDPIEYRLTGITQIQVNSKIDLTFASGLRSILRQDPDIIMVGEIRDRETAEIALHAAQTGHLVLSTLHTNSAEDTITRLIDLGIPPFVLASSLGGILAQRLVRPLCEHCREPALPEELDPLYASQWSALITKADLLYRAIGCAECRYTGYLGRQGVFSLLELDEDLKDAIRNHTDRRAVEDALRNQGYRTLKTNAMELVAKGVTSIREVERVLGSICEETRKDEGSTNSASLSLLSSETQPLSTKKSKPSQPSLLLVEDDKDTREVLKLLFEEELIKVIEATNGKEALTLLYEQPVDIIVCDLRMPVMDGKKFLTRLRADPALCSLPILMLTANTSDENELALLGAGANDYVTKSGHSDILLARVRRLLSPRQ